MEYVLEVAGLVGGALHDYQQSGGSPHADRGTGILGLYPQAVGAGGIWVGPSPSTGTAITASNTAHASLKAAFAVVGPDGAFNVKALRWQPCSAGAPRRSCSTAESNRSFSRLISKYQSTRPSWWVFNALARFRSQGGAAITFQSA